MFCTTADLVTNLTISKSLAFYMVLAKSGQIKVKSKTVAPKNAFVKYAYKMQSLYYLPTQSVLPSPENPSLHWQSYEPSLFTQPA